MRRVECATASRVCPARKASFRFLAGHFGTIRTLLLERHPKSWKLPSCPCSHPWVPFLSTHDINARQGYRGGVRVNADSVKRRASELDVLLHGNEIRRSLPKGCNERMAELANEPRGFSIAWTNCYLGIFANFCAGTLKCRQAAKTAPSAIKLQELRAARCLGYRAGCPPGSTYPSAPSVDAYIPRPASGSLAVRSSSINKL